MITKFFIYLYKFKFPILRKFIERLILLFEGGQAFSPTIRYIYSKYHNIKIGYGSYGGCFSYVNFPKPSNITFGNYCSIGSNLKIFRANHPMNNFTTHPVLYNPIFGYVNHDLLSRPDLIIGHDVWIGSSVIITPKVCHIGDGAVIGAGSVVTKDVDSYSVVAGNPARFIKYRFNSNQMQIIKDSKWWVMSIDELIDNISILENMLNHDDTF